MAVKENKLTISSTDLPGAKEGQPGGAGAQRLLPLHPGESGAADTSAAIILLYNDSSHT